MRCHKQRHKEALDMGQAVDGIISGEALIFMDGEDRALLVGVNPFRDGRWKNPIPRRL